MKEDAVYLYERSEVRRDNMRVSVEHLRPRAAHGAQSEKRRETEGRLFEIFKKYV